MPHTRGYHIVLGTYGQWLPGDHRGHWSTAWDEQIGLTEPNTLHEGDPVRLRMAKERMKHPPVYLSHEMVNVIIQTLTHCVSESDWNIVAAAMATTHIHLQLTYTQRNIKNTIKWIKDQATKSIHNQTTHTGPVWCEGRWCGYIFDQQTWTNTQQYIERHNRNVQYPFVTP